MCGMWYRSANVEMHHLRKVSDVRAKMADHRASKKKMNWSKNEKTNPSLPISSFTLSSRKTSKLRT